MRNTRSSRGEAVEEAVCREVEARGGRRARAGDLSVGRGGGRQGAQTPGGDLKSDRPRQGTGSDWTTPEDAPERAPSRGHVLRNGGPDRGRACRGGSGTSFLTGADHVLPAPALTEPFRQSPARPLSCCLARRAVLLLCVHVARPFAHPSLTIHLRSVRLSSPSAPQALTSRSCSD